MFSLGVVGIPSPMNRQSGKIKGGMTQLGICALFVAKCLFGGRFTTLPVAASGSGAPDIGGMGAISCGTHPLIFEGL